MNCTWVDDAVRCRGRAIHPITAKDGEVWARLCDEHNAAVDKAIQDIDGKAILRCWVRAGGGAKKMAARMFS